MKRSPFSKGGRCTPYCKGVNHFKHKTKEYGSLIETQAFVEEKFNEIKISKRRKCGGSGSRKHGSSDRETERTNLMADSEVAPTNKELI